MSFITKFLWKNSSSTSAISSSSSSSSSSNSEIARRITLRDRPAGLKTLTGRFGVSFVDVEWEDTDNLLMGSEETKLLGHELPFILARLYYPTEQGTDRPEHPENGTWLPSSQYFPGYGYFLRLPTLVSSGIGRVLAANVKICAKEAQPLISIPANAQQEHLPVLIFSHGLAGIRTTYSTICCELASRGIFVLAIEHRDGSASMTVDRHGNVHPYRFGPSGLTLPNVDYDFRAAQLRHRIRELKSCAAFVESLAKAGDSATILKGTPKLPEILRQFKGRLLTERLILMGHSFGGATCLAAAQEISQVTCCVAFDPWMFPLPLSFIKRTDIHTLIVINEKFSWSDNDFAIQNFVDHFRNSDSSSSSSTLFGKARMLGCGHMDQSDLASIIPAKIIQILRPNSSIPSNHHRILQANVDLVAAHLAASLPTYNFDNKWSMADLATFNRRNSPLLLDQDEITADENSNFIDPIIKLEIFINYIKNCNK